MNDLKVEDSPLEPLPFNYLTFDFLTLLNNLWAWLAVSFWRIRLPKPEFPPPSDSPDPAPEMFGPDAVTVSEPAYVPTVVVGNVDVDGVTKGKFTVYYEDDIECESDEVFTVTEEWEDRGGRFDGCDFESEWWESWERLLRLRMGEHDNGWYTCQDLTALNGNVVRLWDGNGEFRFGTFPRESRVSSSCVRVYGNNVNITC